MEELKKLLLEAPSSQLDESMKIFIKIAETKNDWKYILNKCVNGSLCSDFVILVLERMHDMAPEQ